MMLPQPESCCGCPCPGEGFSEPEGSGTLGVLAIGEALGEQEKNDGLPFRPQAPAGSVLERALNRIKWAGAPVGRGRIRLSNVIACQPKGNWLDGAPWEQGAIMHCKPNLDRVVHEMRPSCLLALGGVALRTLTGLAGPRMGISMLRGFVLESTYGIPVVGTYHPSFLRRGSRGRNEETGAKTESGAGKGGMHLLPVFYHDILKSIELAQHGWEKPVTPKYQTAPSLDDAWSFYYRVRDNAGLLVTADIETVGSAAMDEEEVEEAGAIITQIQFSTAPETAIVLPWEGQYKEVARAILATENVKAGHNWWNFDAPRLRAAGVEVKGIVHDTMQMWRRYHPDLPAGLQFVAGLCGFPFPWKHLAASDPEFYGGCDADAPQRIMAALPGWMKSKGCWRSYERHVLKLNPVLERMSERGIPLNDAKRAVFGQKIDAMATELTGKIQELVPEEVKPVHSPGNSGYKRDPKDAVEGGATTHNGMPAIWAKREFDTGDVNLPQALPLDQGASVQPEQHRADQDLYPLPRPPHADRAPQREGDDLEAGAKEARETHRGRVLQAGGREPGVDEAEGDLRRRVRTGRRWQGSLAVRPRDRHRAVDQPSAERPELLLGRHGNPDPRGLGAVRRSPERDRGGSI